MWRGLRQKANAPLAGGEGSDRRFLASAGAHQAKIGAGSFSALEEGQFFGSLAPMQSTRFLPAWFWVQVPGDPLRRWGFKSP